MELSKVQAQATEVTLQDMQSDVGSVPEDAAKLNALVKDDFLDMIEFWFEDVENLPQKTSGDARVQELLSNYFQTIDQMVTESDQLFQIAESLKRELFPINSQIGVAILNKLNAYIKKLKEVVPFNVTLSTKDMVKSLRTMRLEAQVNPRMETSPYQSTELSNGAGYMSFQDQVTDDRSMSKGEDLPNQMPDDSIPKLEEIYSNLAEMLDLATSISHPKNKLFSRFLSDLKKAELEAFRLLNHLKYYQPQK